MTTYTKETFGPDQVVNVDHNHYVECIFNDCVMEGKLDFNKGEGFNRCLFVGRASKWFWQVAIPSTFSPIEVYHLMGEPPTATRH